jgi:hypothetical protein
MMEVTEEESLAIDEKNKNLCMAIKSKLINALGSNGILILDNEVEFLIALCEDYIELLES